MNSNTIRIAPSVLSADFARMETQVELIAASGADWVHLDVMDGSFVPDITFGHKFISDIRELSHLPFDTHLMIMNPERHIQQFADAGSDMITIHAESTIHLHRVIQQIHAAGKRAGISLVPSTPVSAVAPLLQEVDLVLIMTVNPGYGGQELIPFCLDKVTQLVKIKHQRPECRFDIVVDGGVNARNAGEFVTAGAEVLVTGSAFFSSSDPAALVRDLKQLRR